MTRRPRRNEPKSADERALDAAIRDIIEGLAELQRAKIFSV